MRFVVKIIGLRSKRLELKLSFSLLPSNREGAILGLSFPIFKVEMFDTWILLGVVCSILLCSVWFFWCLLGRGQVRNNLTEIPCVRGFVQGKDIVSTQLTPAPC